MNINFVAVIVATAVQFIIGFVWYGPIFGKLWGKIHGFNKLSKEVQQKMMSQMGPYYGLQLLVTLITTIVLANLISASRSMMDPYILASMLWVGFIVPVQVSAVIFGGTEPKWIPTKIALQAGASLLCILAAAAVISMI